MHPLRLPSSVTGLIPPWRPGIKLRGPDLGQGARLSGRETFCVAAKTFVYPLLLSRCVSLYQDRSVSSVCLLSSAARRPPHSGLRTLPFALLTPYSAISWFSSLIPGLLLF